MGDVVGSAGCSAVLDLVPKLREELGLDAVVANAENSAPGGRGITKESGSALLSVADFLTLGNHAFDAEGHETRVALDEYDQGVFHGFVEGVGSGQAYGIRAVGPYDPSRGVRIPATLAQFRKRWPEIRFKASATSFENMLRGLRQGDLDLCVAVTNSKPAIEAQHLWIDQAVWVRSDATQLDPDGVVPLVSFGEDCSCRYTAVNALHRIGRECDFVFTSRSIASLEAAVLAGLGVMVLPRSRVPQTTLTIWEDAPLPELPQLYCGIYLREGGDNR